MLTSTKFSVLRIYTETTRTSAICSCPTANSSPKIRSSFNTLIFFPCTENPSRKVLLEIRPEVSNDSFPQATLVPRNPTRVAEAIEQQKDTNVISTYVDMRLDLWLNLWLIIYDSLLLRAKTPWISRNLDSRRVPIETYLFHQLQGLDNPRFQIM